MSTRVHIQIELFQSHSIACIFEGEGSQIAADDLYIRPRKPLGEVSALYIFSLIYRMPFYKIIVPTVDTIRYDYVVSSLLSNGFPALVVGPVGTGKTSTVHLVLEHLDDVEYAVLLVNMSAQTTSNNVQVRL